MRKVRNEKKEKKEKREKKQKKQKKQMSLEYPQDVIKRITERINRLSENSKSW